MPSSVHAPPATLRWKRTDWSAFSGSTVALTVTGSMVVTVAAVRRRRDGDPTGGDPGGLGHAAAGVTGVVQDGGAVAEPLTPGRR